MWPLKSSVFELAGVTWIAGAVFFFVSQFVRRRISLPSGVASTAQVIGVAALLLAVLGIVWGFVMLARVLRVHGDLFGATALWSIVAGFVLLPALFLGSFLLFPGFFALIVRGRLGRVDVRLPAAALLAGLLTAAVAGTWAGGVEGPIHLNALSILAGSAEGAALVWFGRTTASLR